MNNKMKDRTKVASIIGGVVVVATILIFVLSSYWIFPSSIIGLFFLLYSEIVFFGGFAVIEYWAPKSSGVMTRAGLGTTIGTYAVVVFVSSIIYMNTHIVRYRGFLVLQIILFVLVVAASLIIALSSKTKAVHDSRVLTADAMVRSFVDELTDIKNKVEKKDKIDKLIEAMRYSDTSSMVDVDVEIDETIAELKSIVFAEEFDESEADKNIDKIELLIKKRKLQTKSLKQGGI